MTDAYALSPFPNAIFWNWATIIILCFGNLGALDFQVRCMAAKDPWAAKWGCFVAGLFTLLIGIPFSFLGGITRYVTHFLSKKRIERIEVIISLSTNFRSFLSLFSVQLFLRSRFGIRRVRS
jgi:Na+/pantothenate symporter